MKEWLFPCRHWIINTVLIHQQTETALEGNPWEYHIHYITFSIIITTCLPPRSPPPPSSVRWRWPPASWGHTAGCSRTPSASGQRSAPVHSLPLLYLPHTPEEDIEELDRGPEPTVLRSSSEVPSKLVAVTQVIIPMIFAKLSRRLDILDSWNCHCILNRSS